MFANDQSRYKILIAAVALAVTYTCTGGVSKLKELERLSDASSKNSKTIADYLTRINGHRLSTVSHTVTSTSGVGGNRPARHSMGSPRSLVESCAFILSVFNAHQVHCVGTEKCSQKGTDKSVVADRYRVNLQGDFHAVLNAMEGIETDHPSSCVVSCSMDIKDPTKACNWTLVFEFTEGQE